MIGPIIRKTAYRGQKDGQFKYNYSKVNVHVYTGTDELMFTKGHTMTEDRPADVECLHWVNGAGRLNGPNSGTSVNRARLNGQVIR